MMIRFGGRDGDASPHRALDDHADVGVDRAVRRERRGASGATVVQVGEVELVCGLPSCSPSTLTVPLALNVSRQES